MSQMSKQQDQFAKEHAKALDEVDLVGLVQKEQSMMSESPGGGPKKRHDYVDPVAVGLKRTAPNVTDVK